jgi:antitoxin (DNA-binding transcriptional repressor) of toxin-antitoxin stability system
MSQPMTRTMKASEFKAKCLKLFDEVAQSGETIVITKRGKAIARIEPERKPATGSLFGCMKGEIEIVDPEDDLEAWDEAMERALEARLERLAKDLEAPLALPKRKQSR